MIIIPHDILARYSILLKKKAIPDKFHGYYKKWLRYYLDFCHKYNLQTSAKKSLPQFIKKLHEKKQTELQQKQASHAVSLYYELEQAKPDSLKRSDAINRSAIAERWKAVHEKLVAEIKTGHYSPRTLRAYSGWVWKFQTFINNKNPDALSPEDVKKFLTFLAVKQKVSASTQNQAFNALLFFYRHIIKIDFGEHNDIVRAKRRPYIPVVLSRKEIDRILKYLTYPYDLVVKLMYGCGLRMFECLNLRIHNFNFDEEILTIHDGKGKKDRTVPLPKGLISDFNAYLERVVALHQRDVDEQYDGVFMLDSLGKKNKNASKELIWQWFFPAKTLTFVPDKRERRRYHLHETYVNKAIRQATREARILKRVSAHTFRHSYATHLLQASYDIRTIQELLGHSDVRTTMVYTHCVPSRILKEMKSPLDL